MIIFLYGPDEYRRKQKIDEFREKHRAEKKSVLEASFDLNEDSAFQKFQTFVTSPSLFHPYRFAIVTHVFAYDDEKSLMNVFKSILEDTTLLCVISEERAPRKSFAFLTHEPVLVKQFKQFTNEELLSWITTEAKKRGVSIPRGTLAYLALNYSSNLWGIMTELDTLSLQKKTVEILKEHDLFHADFFGLASSLRVGAPPARIFPVLEVLLEREDPARIFNFLAYRAGSNEKPLFADSDIAVKSGRLDYDTALLNVLIR